MRTVPGGRRAGFSAVELTIGGLLFALLLFKAAMTLQYSFDLARKESAEMSLDDTAEVSSPEGSHPQALAEPYVSLSAHTAPIIQPVVVRAAPSARRGWNLDGRPRRASALHEYGGP